jgi:hypothetical protein
VNGVAVPPAPGIPVPAFSVTFSSVTSGDDTIAAATLDAPAAAAFAASNSTFATVSADDTFVIDSAITPAPGCTFTLALAGEYVHVVAVAHVKPPYTFTAGVPDVALTALAYVPSHT